MAAAAPKLRGAARTANRAGNLQRARKQSARERAGEAWGSEPEVHSGGGETEGGRSAGLRRQQVAASRSGPDQDEALKQAALSSRSGAATLDKRTGEIKEGIGGASSEEAAKQAKELRSGANSGARLAAEQNKERRNMRANSDEAARQNKERRSGRKLGKSSKPSGKLGKPELKNINGQMKEFAGSMWIRTCWAWLFPSFGHSIYLINFSFFVGFFAKWMGFYMPITIPEMGAEWFFKQDLMSGMKGGGQKKSGGAKVLVVKVFEFLFIFMVTGMVFIADLIFIAFPILLFVLFAKLLGII